MIHLNRTDRCGPQARRFAPAHLVNGGVPVDAEKIPSIRGRDHSSAGILEAVQCRDVEMIHVRVREQDQIGMRDRVERRRRRHQALQPERYWPDPNSDSRAEDRIGEDGESVDAQGNLCRSIAYGPSVGQPATFGARADPPTV
jgi:hypothetical protein